MTIFIDCGSNNGEVLKRFLNKYPSVKLAYAFEPNLLWGSDRVEIINNIPVHFSSSAVWDQDTEIPFVYYPKSNKQHASSVVPEKYLALRERGELKKVGDMSEERMVKAIRFSTWIEKTLPLDEPLIIKMDIEGAEYPVLKDLLSTTIFSRIELLFVEWHAYKMQPSSRYDYVEIKGAVTKRLGTKLQKWS